MAFVWSSHVPSFQLGLRPVSLEQIMVFLEIESPSALRSGDVGHAIEHFGLHFRTIGEFYSHIMKAVGSAVEGGLLRYNDDAPRLSPRKGYYVSSNINLMYYNLVHEPVFENSDIGGGLVDLRGGDAFKTALKSMAFIMDQGGRCWQ